MFQYHPVEVPTKYTGLVPAHCNLDLQDLRRVLTSYTPLGLPGIARTPLGNGVADPAALTSPDLTARPCRERPDSARQLRGGHRNVSLKPGPAPTQEARAIGVV